MESVSEDSEFDSGQPTYMSLLGVGSTRSEGVILTTSGPGRHIVPTYLLILDPHKYWLTIHLINGLVLVELRLNI